MKLAATASISFLAASSGIAPEAQQSHSFFDAATVVLDKDVPPFRRMADMDRDGDPDAIGVQLARGNDYYRIFLYKNDGHGRFERWWSGGDYIGHLAASPPGHARNPLAVMALLRNDGAGALSQATLASDPGVVLAVDGREAEDSLAVDVDLDGDLDLLTRTQTLFGATRLWANDGTGRFQAGDAFHERALWAGDVDLDGDLDLITNGSVQSLFTLYLGENAVPGRLPDLVNDPRATGWPYDPADGFSEGDVNQDGYPDFAIAAESYYDALVFNNTFPLGNSLTANVTLDSYYSLGEDPRVELGDLDGDGLVDGLVGPHADEFIEITELYRKRGAGYATFGAFDPLVLQLVPAGLPVDLDQDGDLDLLGSRIAFNRTVP